MSEAFTIYPTHTCFDDTVANLKAFIEKNGDYLTNGKLLIVHGLIKPDGEKELVHSWLELEGKVIIDCGILKGEKISFRIDLEEFYREANVLDATKYTPLQAANTERIAGHCGPWIDRYERLCGKGETIA